MNGDTAGAVAVLGDAVRLTLESKSGTAQFGLAQLAVIAAQQQDWAVAAQRADESMALLLTHRRPDHMQAILTYAASAAVAAHRTLREQALRDLRAASRLYRQRTPGGFPWFAAQSALVMGVTLLELGDVIGARSMADEAQRHAGRLLTDGVLSEQLRGLNDRIDAADRPDTDPSAGALTAAELRVLEMLVTHLALREIADELNLSRNTVKTHVTRIHRKLGCSTRTDVVQRARTLGLIAGVRGGQPATST
jgi:LuxR family maltose regulon positive regulatory protein